MDAKSLELLRQLKNSLAQERKDQEWPETTCRFCKTNFRYHHSWKPVPIMCRGCRIERKTPYKPGEGDTLYLEMRVFSGGSPGGGRRK